MTDKIYIIEEYLLCKMDYIVEATSQKEAIKKFDKGQYYTFSNTPEQVRNSGEGVSVRASNDRDEQEPRYRRAMQQITDDKLPVEAKPLVKKKRGRPKKHGN